MKSHFFPFSIMGHTALKPYLGSFIITVFLLANSSNSCFSQTVLLNEDFGTTNTLPTGWTASSTGWQNDNTGNSSGYAGASGNSGVKFSNNIASTTSLTYDNNLSTVGYSNITVLWGAKYTRFILLAATISTNLSWSADGITWTNVSFTDVAATGVWTLVNNGVRIPLPAGAAGIPNLRLRFTAVASNALLNASYLIDDVTVTGCPASGGSLVYSGSPFCITTAPQAPTRTGASGGIYSSTQGLSINAVTGIILPGASTAGSYIVTYTIPASGSCALVSTATAVTVTPSPAATITYAGNPFCSDAGIAAVIQTGTTGGMYSSAMGLSINNSSGAINTNASAAGLYTVFYTIPAAGGCSQYQTTTGITIHTAGVWTGAVNNDYNNPQNWLCGTVPATTGNLVVPGGLARYPVVTATNRVNNLTIASGASFTVKGTLQVGGTILNNGIFSATDGTIELNGNTTQQISAGLFDSAAVKNLTIGNTAGVTLTATLNVTGVLRINAGQFNTGDKLILKSTATGTAMVGTITSAATTPINGKVTVERFIPGRRKYRLITAPVTTSTAITLSAGQENLSIWGAWQNSGNNSTPNSGTFITGGSGADGFDTQTSNASLFTYDEVNRRFTGFTTANGKNTKYTPLKAGTPYYLFVYGDRTNTITTSAPNNTVLSATGTLLTGNQNYTTTSPLPLSSVVGRFTLLGNPFASAINWATLPKTNLDNAYWGWDPNLGNTGGYLTVLTNGTVTLQAPYIGSTSLNQYIQPGQGFFVKTTAASPTLAIREQDKVTNFNATAFRTVSIDNTPLLAINLFYLNGNNNVLADGVIAAFDHTLTDAFGQADATKLSNSTESIAILKDTALLSIHTQPLPYRTDTLQLAVWQLSKPYYVLQLFAQQLVGTGTQAFLYDQYLDTLHLLSFTDTNYIGFNVIPGIAASSNSNRFCIVFRSTRTPLPLQFTQVQASAGNKQVQLAWTVANETDVQRYLVEKATNETDFKQIGMVNTKASNPPVYYNWLDSTPAIGNNYYRIRAVQKDGSFFRSKTILVKMGMKDAAIHVFPNPTTGNQVTIQSAYKPRGKYAIRILNTLGMQMLYKEINHTGGAFAPTIHFGSTLADGLYYLTIESEGVRNYQSFFVQ